MGSNLFERWGNVFVDILLYFSYKFISFIDPHIKVSGKKENVKEAKEKIMSVLDTKVSKLS